MCCYEDFFFNKVLLSKGLFHVSYNFFKIIHVSLSLTIEDPSPPLPLLKIIMILVYGIFFKSCRTGTNTNFNPNLMEYSFVGSWN